MTACRLDGLPVELIHNLFGYFAAHEIFSIFSNVSLYLNGIINGYTSYHVNFQSINRTDFDLACQHIVPSQVVSMTLSNDEHTPGLMKIFVSRFQLSQFTRLKSLKLIEIGAEFWECIMTKLVELKDLRTLLYINPNRLDEWVSKVCSKTITKLDESLAKIYAPILPQLIRLRLSHGNYLKLVQLSNLRHLVLNQSDGALLRHISFAAPQLRSLDLSVFYEESYPEIIYPLPQVTRIVLDVQGNFLSINNIERMMTNLPRLKHMKLTGNCEKNVVDGYRLELKAKHLVSFEFSFCIYDILVSSDLDSFRTSFWLQEKQWFVCYYSKYFFTMSYLSKITDGHFVLPTYSTVLDDTYFYTRTVEYKSYFNNELLERRLHNIKKLTLSTTCNLSTVENNIDLNTIQILSIELLDEHFSLAQLISKMPSVHHLCISIGPKYLLKHIDWQIMENIRILEISCSAIALTDDTIAELSTIFPNTERLHIRCVCSIEMMLMFLDRFEHLLTASFQYTNFWLNFSEVSETAHSQLQLMQDLEQCSSNYPYTYRITSTAVHFWL
ncbi:unnamed protein product [Adineta ricciae]|uniref:F-box domain-containing protein n=1 Tax=Adineta ricciae TaxID=249248 RepID=A0A813P918_ADIRI|nr:unnamed protein product [Adineta ricciae]CAF1030921.1 unnamed protein product [Adineta ricciae]